MACKKLKHEMNRTLHIYIWIVVMNRYIQRYLLLKKFSLVGDVVHCITIIMKNVYLEIRNIDICIIRLQCNLQFIKWGMMNNYKFNLRKIIEKLLIYCQDSEIINFMSWLHTTKYLYNEEIFYLRAIDCNRKELIE